jgi:hypothetical protein
MNAFDYAAGIHRLRTEWEAKRAMVPADHPDRLTLRQGIDIAYVRDLRNLERRFSGLSA